MATAVNAGGTVTYQYNALNLRMSKVGPMALVPTGAAYFVYDEQGQLLGEYDANGAPMYETIYLDALPVGALKRTGTAGGNNLAVSVYNVHADHLGAARIITRPSDKAIVWRWDTAESYGGSAAVENPSSLGAFTFNQRFPGQVFDAGTGLFQNWNREYNSRMGRYVQSDPIGLAGGINTYSYANGSPLMFVDPRGLDPWAFAGQGDTTSCSYYDEMAKKNPSCGYYKAGGSICRGLRPDVNGLVIAGLSYSWATGRTKDSQSTVLNNIRVNLIAEDKKARASGAIDASGCTCGNDIDEYHNRVFENAGLPKASYGGNWIGQGVPPNPVPRDPRNKTWNPGNWGRGY